ncbi:HNH endonuclease family protein [Streptomyces nigrescens]|uniref:HNH endonuclease family protein n=1 Tax=Streptomyces nigrescens TaxID=1920 RepID=A0ABY7IXS5_STRNI|nr:HNH endonuclease family protein [Streptomyces nigrescens]WAU03720.1 HNH endonuclease family protein [Streptomyces nigrescens]
MIKTTAHALAAAALALLPLATAVPAHAAETLSLHDAIEALPHAAESRDGYERSKFKHRIDEDKDGCNTRAEVLLAEALTPPAVGPGCRLTGGTWFSYYDDTIIDGPSGLDIDHMVPLAEAWDSGASQWTAARRQAYANDLGAERSLVAVTARSNRQKADQDPAEWTPPAADAQCTYLSDWVGTKLRWSLTVDRTERDTLRQLAAGCEDTDVEYERV